MNESDGDPDSPCYGGLDGGGTHTRVVLGNAQGEVVAEGSSGSGNYHDVSLDTVSQHFREAFDAAWSQLGTNPQPLRSTCFGLASVNTPHECEQIRQRVRNFPEFQRNHSFREDSLQVVHDLRIAHAGALAGEPGIVLIVGTGSSCWGIDHHGNHYQAGGWGSLLDDGGSATFLGLEAMRAVVKAFDGRSPATSLTETILRTFELTELRDLLKVVDHDGLPRKRIAQLAREVVNASRDGDAVASTILERGVEELVQCAVAVEKKLKFEGPFAVAASGGLAESASVYRKLLHHRLQEVIPHARPQDPRFSPALGALELARTHQP